MDRNTAVLEMLSLMGVRLTMDEAHRWSMIS